MTFDAQPQTCPLSYVCNFQLLNRSTYQNTIMSLFGLINEAFIPTKKNDVKNLSCSVIEFNYDLF